MSETSSDECRTSWGRAVLGLALLTIVAVPAVILATFEALAALFFWWDWFVS